MQIPSFEFFMFAYDLRCVNLLDRKMRPQMRVNSLDVYRRRAANGNEIDDWFPALTG